MVCTSCSACRDLGNSVTTHSDSYDHEVRRMLSPADVRTTIDLPHHCCVCWGGGGGGGHDYNWLPVGPLQPSAAECFRVFNRLQVEPVCWQSKCFCCSTQFQKPG